VGEYKIKLLTTDSMWEGKVKIFDGVLTYVSRDIARSNDLSSGQILTLEKLASDQSAELAVVSTPDQATISVDGLDSGKAPLMIHDISAGDHEIVISADGYSDQVIRGKIVAGYRLNAIIKLAKLPFIQPVPTADLVSSSSAYVLIKDTPTGFLRVRTDPSTDATEVARVNPGEKYSLLSEQTGWVKIKLSALSGWVSDQYVDKIK